MRTDFLGMNSPVNTSSKKARQCSNTSGLDCLNLLVAQQLGRRVRTLTTIRINKEIVSTKPPGVNPSLSPD